MRDIVFPSSTQVALPSTLTPFCHNFSFIGNIFLFALHMNILNFGGRVGKGSWRSKLDSKLVVVTLGSHFSQAMILCCTTFSLRILNPFFCSACSLWSMDLTRGVFLLALGKGNFNYQVNLPLIKNILDEFFILHMGLHKEESRLAPKLNFQGSMIQL